jgi:uncharacterized membrane protein
MPALSISDCIQFGWENFKTRPGILIGAFLLTILVPAIPGILFPGPEITPGVPPPPPSAAATLASLVGVVLGVFATLGATTFALRAHDDIAHVEIGDLWNPKPFWRFLGTQLLVGLIVFAGILLFVIPGIIAAVGLGFAPYAVIDRGAGVIDSLKQSWDITRGHKWQLFLFGLVLIGLNLLGLLAFLVGLLVTIPMTWLAVTHAYRTLAPPAASRAQYDPPLS